MVQKRLHENRLAWEDSFTIPHAKCGAVYMISTVAVPVLSVEREVTLQRMDQPFLGAFFFFLVSHTEKQIMTTASVMACYHQTWVLKDYGNAIYCSLTAWAALMYHSMLAVAAQLCRGHSSHATHHWLLGSSSLFCSTAACQPVWLWCAALRCTWWHTMDACQNQEVSTAQYKWF